MLLGDLLILALATWIVSYALVYLDMPYKLMSRFRAWTDWELLKCIYCVSLWVSAAFCFAYTMHVDVIEIAAVSGLSMLMWRFTGGVHG